MIVVGGLYAEDGVLKSGSFGTYTPFKGGEKWKYSRDDPLVDIWAPSYQTTCAKGPGVGFQIDSGTYVSPLMLLFYLI